MADESRLAALREMLADDPQDAFARYAVALELRGLGRGDEALRELEALLESAPDYVATYQQAGKLYHELGRTPRALEVVARGIEVAAAAGEDHERRELEELLEVLQA